MSWNGLQETLAELFADLFDRTNWKLAIAAWHSLTSDVSQQEMLRSVAKQGPCWSLPTCSRFLGTGSSLMG